MADANSPDIGGSKFSRRDFLKVSALATAVVAGEGIRRNLPAISKFWDESGAMLTGKVEDLDQITSEIPKSLEGKNIPIENEWFKNIDVVLNEGIALYEEWRVNDSTLPELHYKKPENYLNIPSMAYQLKQKVMEAPEKMDEGYLGYVDYLLDAADEFDMPYSMFFEGSASGISSIQQMVAIDPGTGLVKEIRQSMKEKFGNEFDVWSACRYGPLTDEQRQFFGEKFQNWYSGAMKYVEGVRTKSSEQISTSVLFAYFLYKNKGDILASTWDTSTWLKITARNDINNDLKRDPNYDRAKKICSIFKDEFSLTVSANWVIENVDRNDELLNYAEDPYAHFQYKDYMPPNRAGGFYHAWNIMALCMSMSSFLAKRMVATQLNPSFGDDGKRWTEYGKVKSKADMYVVDKADEIDKIVNKYK